MKIEQSAVTMNAEHSFSSKYEVSYDSGISFRTLLDGVAQSEEVSADGNPGRETRLLMILEALIARMLALISGSADAQITDLREVLKADNAALANSSGTSSARVLEMEWKSEFTETIREHERTDFSSTGQIRTTDGRSLDFTLELAMCRDFACERSAMASGTVVLRDPLVINFDGKAAELSGKRFEFDLDADGNAESISGLGRSTGYLAIDRNSDGRINDGSELFGTRSGNGFADLAKLDGDGNHWLDEADAAFRTLRIWQRDDGGEDSLSSLGEQGIGALYLGSTETPFALTDADNQVLARIRASGLYLREDGSAGTLQQVDLAV